MKRKILVFLFLPVGKILQFNHTIFHHMQKIIFIMTTTSHHIEKKL